MKRFLLSGLLLLGAPLYASYSTDVPGHAVKCIATNSPGTTVTLSEDRKELVIFIFHNRLHYEVSPKTQTDGKTYVTYAGQYSFAQFDDQATITFSDGGDTCTLSSGTLQLNCQAI